MMSWCVVWFGVLGCLAQTWGGLYRLQPPPSGSMERVTSTTVSATLVVSPLRFTSGSTPIQFWTRAYNGSLPGPTLRVKQGDTLHLTLHNQLGSDHGGKLNTLRYPNTTNIHLHGMHITPEGKGDDPFRLIRPGSTWSYEYQIPIDHSPGMFLYHPHVQGSSTLQHGGGMVGALIVDPIDPSIVPPELKAMKEVIMVLQHLNFHTEDGDTNPYLDHLVTSKWCNDTLYPRPTYLQPHVQDFFLVNGQYLPTVEAEAGEYQLFRVIHGSVGAFVELQMQHPSGGSPCDMYVIARDGIYVDRPYANSAPLLVPASRVDLAVRCSKPGHYVLYSSRTAPYQDDIEPTTPVFNGTLANLVISGSRSPMSLPSRLPSRPKYLSDLRNATIPDPAYFTMMFSSEGGPVRPGPPYPKYYVNQHPFQGKDVPARKLELGAVQEWNLRIDKDESQGENHPFHIHVNPFQVVGYASGESTVLDVPVGEWRDTVALLQYDQINVRMRPDRFTGHAFFHCHTVPHVDLGMAAVALIAPSDDEDTTM